MFVVVWGRLVSVPRAKLKQTFYIFEGLCDVNFTIRGWCVCSVWTLSFFVNARQEKLVLVAVSWKSQGPRKTAEVPQIEDLVFPK